MVGRDRRDDEIRFKGAAREAPLTLGGFVTATHEALFAPERLACDVCAEPLPDTEDEDGYEIAGRGLFVWRRGGQTHREEPPLCPSCASAIGLTALMRWAIEEDEG